MRRVPCPVFFQSDNYSIAVQSANGINQIITIVEGKINIDNFLEDMNGIGILIDADFGNNGAFGRFNALKSDLENLLRLPDRPGEVLQDQPNTGIFVFPDNVNEGTLENVLLKCAEQTYPDIYNGANGFVSNVNIDILDHDDKKDFIAPSGKNKSIAGCIGNIMRPGKAIQVSIQDNRWINDHTINITEIRDLNNFISCLFNFN